MDLLVEVFSRGDSSLKCSLVTLRDRWLVITPSDTDHIPLVNVLGAPTLGDGSVGQWDGKESFFPNGLSLVGTFKLRFVKMRPSGPLFDSKLQSISFDRFRTPHGASSTGSSWVGPRRLPLWSRCEPIHLGTCMALSMAHGDRIKRTLVAAKAKRKQSMSNPSVG